MTERAPRYALSLQVWFASPDGLAVGQTLDISASGMLVHFEQLLDVWLTGELTTHVHDHSIKLMARVIRVEGHEAALTFKIRGAEDRVSIEELMTAAVEQGKFVAPTP